MRIFVRFALSRWLSRRVFVSRLGLGLGLGLVSGTFFVVAFVGDFPPPAQPGTYVHPHRIQNALPPAPVPIMMYIYIQRRPNKGAEPRLGSVVHGNALRLRRVHGRVRAQRIEELDNEQPHSRPIRRVGAERDGQDKGIRHREGHAGIGGAEDRGEVRSQGERDGDDIHGGRKGPGAQPARRIRPEGVSDGGRFRRKKDSTRKSRKLTFFFLFFKRRLQSIQLPEQRAIRDSVGGARGRRGLLLARAGVRHGTPAVRRAPGGQPARAEEARRHDNGHIPRQAGMPAGGTAHGGRECPSEHGVADQAEQLREGARDREGREGHARGERHIGRVPRLPAHVQPGGREHLRGHARHSRADPGEGDHGHPRFHPAREHFVGRVGGRGGMTMCILQCRVPLSRK